MAKGTIPEGARPADVDHLAWLGRYEPLSWAGKKVLDLGCGSGFLCAEAKRGGAAVVIGVDLAPPDAPPSGWSFCQLDLEAAKWAAEVAALSPGGFDYVFAFDILEHLSAPAMFLQACRDLLVGEAGQLVLTTPNTSSWERLWRPSRWSGAQDPQHRVLFNRYSLNFLLARLGLQATQLRAPLRALGALGGSSPQIGAQIFCVAKKA